MVLAMSNRGSVSIPARAPTRVRAQVPEEGAGGGRACEHDQPGRVLRSRGASVCVSHAPYPTTTSCAQRHKLGSNLTPVTRETFAKWKQTRMNKKEAEADAMRKAKDAQASAGKSSGMSGRDLFQYNPEWFQDSDEEEEEAAENERIRLLSIQDDGP